MKILVTGAAGFIGYHAARRLLEAGADVIGVDVLTASYDLGLKRDRLARLNTPRFQFHEVDIAECEALSRCAGPDIETILHLAAQAGVRRSLEDPFSYERSNVAGHLSVLEYARRLKRLRHVVYASSSSVYGDRIDAPFKESDRCEAPASIYAATKRAGELISETFSRVYDLPQTGLRFFTVYGEYGRPDMAYWSFLENMLEGRPITLFNHGRLERDFTSVEDIAPMLVKILEKPPTGAPPHAIYNLGAGAPVTLARFVNAIEQAAGRQAQIHMEDMQPGDVRRTFADISRAQRDFGYSPKVGIEEGMASFVAWFLAYRRERGLGSRL